jgi:hypothetical protein
MQRAAKGFELEKGSGKGVGSNYGMIWSFHRRSTDLSRAQSLTEIFLDVCFEALAANREPFSDATANFVDGFVIHAQRHIC